MAAAVREVLTDPAYAARARQLQSELGRLGGAPAAADLLVQAIRAAGPAPTRHAVLAHLQTQTEFTADGLLSPRNPAAKDTGDCFAVITVEGGAWRRLEPAAGFVNC